LKDILEDRDRLATMKRYRLMDQAEEPQFDAIVQEAAETLGTSMSTVTLIDAERQWFKARVGVPHRETPISESICAHVVASGEALVLPDANADSRFDDNAKVGGDGGVRFYAGVPLTLRDGSRIGALCVLDQAPRDGVDEASMAALERLARRTVAAFEASRDIGEAIGRDPISVEDRVWLDQAATWLDRASAALDRVGATAPAAELDRVITMVQALREDPADAA